MRQVIVGIFAWSISLAIGPVFAADSGAPDPVAGCVDPRHFSPSTRIETCKSLLASGTLTPDQAHAAIHGLGIAYAQRGDFVFAIDAFTTAITKYPGNVHDYLSRGQAYVERGESDLGLADFNAAITLDPKRGYLLRAAAYYKLGKYELALADCNSELKFVPNDALAKYLRDRAKAHIPNP